MQFDDEKYLNAKEAFTIYMSVKLSLQDGYDVSKYGLYSRKFEKMFESPDRVHKLFEALANKYQTEFRLVSALAGNFIIDPNIFVTDLDEKHYIRLRKYNTNTQNFIEQANNLFDKYKAGNLLKDGNLIDLFITGEISPELFSSLGIIFNYDDLFCKTSQGYVWGLLKKRTEAYKNYVTINSDRKHLISTLASILKSKSI
jgi:hypothetical protein